MTDWIKAVLKANRGPFLSASSSLFFSPYSSLSPSQIFLILPLSSPIPLAGFLFHSSLFLLLSLLSFPHHCLPLFSLPFFSPLSSLLLLSLLFSPITLSFTIAYYFLLSFFAFFHSSSFILPVSASFLLSFLPPRYFFFLLPYFSFLLNLLLLFLSFLVPFPSSSSSLFFPLLLPPLPLCSPPSSSLLILIYTER